MVRDVRQDHFGLFDNVPGPSPWYLTPATRTVQGFRWQSAGDGPPRSGKTILVGSDGPVAVLDFYNYVRVLDDSSLLIWHQQWSESVPSEPVRLLVVQPQRLTPLPEDLVSVYENMSEHRIPVTLGGRPDSELSLVTHNCVDELRAQFPEELRSLEELLILCHCSGIRTAAAREQGDSALLVVHPPRSTYRLYPQDWFNCGGRDYGYEWITRVVRNTSSGQVHGEGQRIAPFVLDDSCAHYADRRAPSDDLQLGDGQCPETFAGLCWSKELDVLASDRPDTASVARAACPLVN